MVFDQRMLVKYIGKSNPMGFIQDTIYEVIITQKKHGYEITALYDTTHGHEVNLFAPYSSEKSVLQSWDI